MSKFVASVFMAVVAGTGTGDIDFTSLGKITKKHAAFLQVTSYEDSDPFILVTDFSGSPLSNGAVSVIPGIRDAVVAGDVSSLQPTRLDTGKINFQWPNNAQVVPREVFGFRAIVVPDGFLVPGHKDGGVYVIQMDDTDVT